MSSSSAISPKTSSTNPRILTGESPFACAPRPPATVTTLPALFQQRAKDGPTNIAFSCQTRIGLKTWTYAEADAEATSLAKKISALLPARDPEVRPAPVVAIWLEKGIELVLGTLGITYAGATWLPLDPDAPVERAAICLADAAANLIICDDIHLGRAQDAVARARPDSANPTSIQVVTFAALSEILQDEADSLAQRDIRLLGPKPHDAAYLIYTSGTTGTPKGIAIPHLAALTFSLSERKVLETSPKDVVWNGFSPAFDMFVEEMWVTIAGGGHLAVGTREEVQDIAGLASVWQSRGVTIVNAVPTLIGIMDMSQHVDGPSFIPPSVRLINLGGEACPPALVKRIARPGLRIINTYGPTETTVTATWDELQPDVPVTIGRPLPSYHACILSIPADGPADGPEALELQDGVEGELAIGGPCLALGYVGRNELTAQKFIKHPLGGDYGERIYRTGDRVRLQADHKIVFLGRIDTQVKHRGFRIELGEIESQLSGHPAVQAAAVILAYPDGGDARLEAFVVLRPGAVRDVTTIHQLAAQRLPSYMRPEEVYFLYPNEMPRLPSGKINSKALHDLSTRKAAELTVTTPACDQSSQMALDVDEDSPLGVMLKGIVTIFPKASKIEPHSDFFDDLGGHSLTAAKLVSFLRNASIESTGSMPFRSIGLPDIYEGRTPAGIAARFPDQEVKGASTSTISTTVNELLGAGATGLHTGKCWPVPTWKFWICGLFQIIPLVFLFFVASVEILVPYLLFDYLIVDYNAIGWASLAAYGVFVTIPFLMTAIAIAGKWIILGKAREGEYPLYGIYYFRWWTAERLVRLANPKLIADSALYPFLLRALGAKVGGWCHLGSLSIGAACDLVEIGEDVVIGADVVLAVSVIERGRLILKKIVIGNDAIIGSHSVIEGGASVGEAAEVASLSMVAAGMQVPSFERYHGSPARFERDVHSHQSRLGRRSRPSPVRMFAMSCGNAILAALGLPLLYLLPQIPGLMLFDVVDLRHVSAWGQVAILACPIAFAYQLLVFGQLLLLRWLVLGRLREGRYKIYSTWYLRKWFLDRVFDLALDILHPVFASLYIVPFLRALGVNIGRRAEVSTARGINFELVTIGDESFVADAVLIGDTEIRGNELTLQKTTMAARSFAGNVSLLPQGTELASGTLVGVLSKAPPPHQALAADSSCFGSPPVIMPTRHRLEGHAEELLFRPSKGRVAARLIIEGLRIVVPRAIIVFGLGFALQVVYAGYHRRGIVETLLLLPAFYFIFFALPALTICALLKWILIGVYKPAEWPLWSLNVWLSEAVTSTYETLAEPLLTAMLVGTPYLAICFRLFGVKIGARVTLLSSDITEFDCVTIGDEVMVNEKCGAQTHLFEDRIMKVGRVELGCRACIKPYSICLPGSVVSADAQLGSLSLLMKGESLPEATAWEGAPVKPREVRGSPPSLATSSSSLTSRTLSTISLGRVESKKAG